MSKHKAFANYGQQTRDRNYNNKNKINNGNKINDNIDDDGAEVPTYKMSNTPDKIMRIREAIKIQLSRSIPEIGKELRTGENSKYAAGPAMPETELTALPPQGLGPRPLVNFADWDANAVGLRKRWIIEQGNYIKNVREAKGLIAKIYIAPRVLLAIQNSDVYINAEEDDTSVSKFIDAIAVAIDQNLHPMVDDDERKENEIAEIKRNIKEKRIEGDCSAYLEEMKLLMTVYRTALEEEKIIKLQNNLTEIRRRNSIIKIKDEIYKETDRDKEIIGRIYKQIKRFGMDADNVNYYSQLEVQHKCIKGDEQSTPFSRKVSADGVVTGGVDNMINELLQTVRAQEAAKGDGTAIFYISKKSDGERPLKRAKLDISNMDVITPCTFCKDTLKFDRGAKSHEFSKCRFNQANENYVGDEKKAERIRKATFYQGRQRESQSGGRSGRGTGGRDGRGRRGR